MMLARFKLLLPLVLAAIFLIAQVQGTVHGIGHLNAGVGAADQGLTSHGGACLDCEALAQAGAAPVFASMPLTLASYQDAAPALPAWSVHRVFSPRAYRSRAPPASPV